MKRNATTPALSTGTFRLRLTPRQYPVMQDLVLHRLYIGMDSLQKYDNGVIRSLHHREFVVTVGDEKHRHLEATDNGVQAVELYHHGKIVMRKTPGDITEYVRVMLKLKRNGSK